MKIFVAYPYAKGVTYRTALATALPPDDFKLLYADERLTSGHLLRKIEEYLEESDLALFDLSDINPNVILELGIAIGARHPYVVAIDKASVGKLNADIHGWDQLRYSTVIELSAKLRDFINRGQVPRRTPGTTTASIDLSDHDHGFFLGAIGVPELAVIVVPLPYEEGRQELVSLRNGTFPRNALIDSVSDGLNALDSHKFAFWSGGFSWTEGEDHFDLFESPGTSVSTLRLRLSDDGILKYVHPIIRLDDGKPCFDLTSFEAIVRGSIVFAANLYRRVQITAREVSIGVAIRQAPNLRIAQGLQLQRLREQADPLVLPRRPITVAISELERNAESISRQISRVLTTKLSPS